MPSSSLRLFLRNQVALVDDDDVGKLNLIGQQIHNGSFVFFVRPHLTILKVLGAVKISKKVGRIHHGDHGVHIRNVTQTVAFFITERERRGNGHGLADSGGLDQQIIKPTFPGQLVDFNHEVFPQRAANATVGHLDEGFFGTGEL